ncbi:MAG: DNA polymerase III subunit gamma/tau [Candidatus Sericytochromatia bacterium]|nr:DNA polymerase III subunit gamma/tau [Candidatus Sericytochromatia bacterium]
MTPYLALYRKYRPGTFADLVGQEAVASTLSRALAQSRLAHAYLFCGPRGTGKTSVARILAKSVNCQEGPTATPCGACPNCRDITAGAHLDVIEIDAASNNGVDNIRDLQDRVALAPVLGRSKVYIIDEVHMLSQGAFNALLKTLEEPPPHVMFILATTDPHKVLPTIVSRCQRFDFGRIPLAALVARLAQVAQAEAIAAEPAALEAIARRAQGGLRDALSLLDQLAAGLGGETLTLARVNQGLGLVGGEEVATLGEALIGAAIPDALTVAASLLAAGHDHGAIVRELMNHFRHLMVLLAAPERANELEVPLSQQQTLRAQAARVSLPELAWMLESLNETDGLLRRSPQQAIWLELGLIRLASRPAIPSLLELAGRVEALEAALTGGVPRGPAAPARPSVSRPPAPQASPAAAPPPPARAASSDSEAAPPEPASRPESPAPATVAASPLASASVPAAAPPPAPTPSAEGAPAPGEGSDAGPSGRPTASPPPAPDDGAGGLPPRPPLAVLPGGASQAPQPPAVNPPPAAPPRSPGSLAGGSRAVPPGAWDSVQAYVRARSVPTAALLAQKVAIAAWEGDGAVVLRMAKPFKDQFDRQAPKKTLLVEAIRAVFGPDAYLRIDTQEASRAAPSPSAPSATPLPPAPAAPVPIARPAAPPPRETSAPPAAPGVTPARPVAAPPSTAAPPEETFDYQPPDAPSAWDDDVAHDPPLETGPVASGPAAARGQTEAPLPHEDSAIRLAMELFNGRLMSPPGG